MYLRWLTRTAILLALTIAVQMFGWPQPVTGPLVNAMLLLACIFAGPSSGAVIGLATPLLAYARGILAPPLAPMIPAIMLSNAVFVLLFWFVKKMNSRWGEFLGLLAAAVVKFLILAAAVKLVAQLPPQVARAMQWPQLVTAIAGGLIAIAVSRALPQLKK
ncbi:MAG: ECF transporter S component [Firmicutes bacterium]|jgi:hypothetical protein|nr:ECF transporter S component [Bacillota bacterium]HQD40547.1 ECF transporter S component [Bacillota bacterium]